MAIVDKMRVMHDYITSLPKCPNQRAGRDGNPSRERDIFSLPRLPLMYVQAHMGSVRDWDTEDVRCIHVVAAMCILSLIRLAGCNAPPDRLG